MTKVSVVTSGVSGSVTESFSIWANARLAATLGMLLFLTTIAGQEFEVASIRPHRDLTTGTRIEGIPQGLRANGTNLLLLIQLGWTKTSRQIVDGPGWIRNEYYDVEARGEDITPANVFREKKVAIQKLLADRFGLRVHEEQREMPALVLTAQDLKVPEWTDATPSFKMTRTSVSGHRLSLAAFCRALSDMTDELYVNGIQGVADKYFDIEVEWTRLTALRPEADQEIVSLSTALSRYGIAIKRQKVPVDVLVIDRVHRPTEN